MEVGPFNSLQNFFARPHLCRISFEGSSLALFFFFLFFFLGEGGGGGGGEELQGGNILLPQF